MANLDELDVRPYVVSAMREYVEDAEAGAELAAYGDMPEQMEGVVYLAAERGLCIVRAAPMDLDGHQLQGATPELVPWSEVRGFRRAVTYGSHKGSGETVARTIEVSIQQPPVDSLTGNDYGVGVPSTSG